MKTINLNRKLLLVAFNLLLCNYVFGQAQDAAFQKTYWEYRDRFKKYFTKIGKNDGESIPIESVAYTWEAGEFTCDPDFEYTIHYHDATAFLGDYISLLATEYKLLKNNNQDVQPTLNELYYALHAVKRLDQSVEPYMGRSNCWSSNQSLNENGFFMRDDPPANFYSNWKNIYDQTPATERDRRTNIRAMQGDAYLTNVQYGCNASDPAFCDRGNEESQDQVIYLLQGLALVKKLVDDVHVQPTAADAPGFNVVSEAENIAGNIINWIIDGSNGFTMTISNDQLNMLGVALVAESVLLFMVNPALGTGAITITTNLAAMIIVDPEIAITNLNYSIGNPVSGGLVHTGGFVEGFAYPLTKIATYLTGRTNFPDMTGTLKMNQTHGIPFQESFSKNVNDLPKTIWDDLGAGSFADGLSVNIPMTTFDVDLGGSTSFFDEHHDYNRYMTLLMAAMSNTWTSQQLHLHCVEGGREMLLPDLLYAVMHDEQMTNQQIYYPYLSSAPCDGPNQYNGNNWNKTQRWSSPHETVDAQEKPKGYFNGVDYMLFYNLYRLGYESGNPGDFAPYKDDYSCPCDFNTEFDGDSHTHGTLPHTIIPTSSTIDANTPGNHTVLNNSQVTIRPQFTDYSQIGITTHQYLNHDLTISGTGKLTNLTELIVCGGTLEIQNVDGLVLGDGTIDGAILRVRSGSTLKLKTGSRITVNDKSKIIIEDGAQLVYESGANIILQGPDALIDVKSHSSSLNLYLGSMYVGSGTANKGGELLYEAGSVNLTLSAVTNHQCRITFAIGCDVNLNGSNTFVEEGENSVTYFSNLGSYNYALQSSDLLTINKGGLPLGGKLIFDQGMFYLYGGKVINTDCEFRLGNGSSLWYRDGSEIQLLNDNAVLDIGGDLNIDNNATFTFTYPGHNSGYIRMSALNYGDGSINLWCGTHAKFDLTGKNKQDKILEVTQETLYDPTCSQHGHGKLDLFKITSGKVEFGSRCRMALAGPCDLRNVRFTTMTDPPNIFFWCLEFFGQDKVKFINNEIDHAEEGILAFLSIGGHPMSIVDCYIHDLKPSWSGIGIHTYGSGLYAKGNIIKDFRDYGIFMESNNMTSTLISNEIYTSNPDGVGIGMYYDNNQGVLNLTDNYIHDNFIGLRDDQGGGVTNARCNTISNNSTAGILIGYDGVLNLAGPLAAGYNNLSDNGKTILTSGGNSIDLQEGYNNLAPLSAHSQCYSDGTPVDYCNDDIIAGDLTEPACGTGSIPAKYNQWSFSNFTPLNNQNGGNCMTSLFYTIGCPGIAYSVTDDAPQLAAIQCGLYDNGGCPDPPNCEHRLMYCPECSTISTQMFGSKKLNDAVQLAISTFSTGDSLFLKSFHGLAQIINTMQKYPFNNESERYLYNLSYRYIQRAFTEAINIGQIIIDTTNTQFNPDEKSLLNIINQRIDSTVVTDYKQWLYANIDKAEFYRRIDRHDLGIGVYNSIYSKVDLKDLPQIDHRLCFMDKENQLIKRQIDADTFLKLLKDECGNGGDDARMGNRPQLFAETKKSIKKEISVYPNPATSQMTISLKNFGSDNKNIIIYDCFGKEVKDFGSTGKNEVEENVNNYPKGIYLVKAVSGNQVLTSKFVVN